MSVRRSLALAAGALSLALGACGQSTQTIEVTGPPDGPPPAAPTATPVRGNTVTVKATEFAFAPAAIIAKAGRVTVRFENAGKMDHQFVVLRTAAAPGSLPVVAGGRVSEADVVGRPTTLPAGRRTTVRLRLTPGRYTYVCNEPGHYSSGMEGTLTVR